MKVYLEAEPGDYLTAKNQRRRILVLRSYYR
jgi:hypothetical protein